MTAPRSDARESDAAGSAAFGAAVDVLLPVRDAAATLAEALESIRGQTLTDFRCLVLDDGSADGSLDLVRGLAAEDSRFVPVEGPARGLVATLNRGLDLATAPLVARIDGDDRMEPARLALQVETMRRHPETDVISSRVRFFGDRVSSNLRHYEGWLNATLTHEEIVRDLFIESPLPHPSVTIRTESIRGVGGYRDVEYPEDYDLWLRGWRAGWRFAKRAEVLTQIRDHAGRLTKTDPRYAGRAFLECKAEHLVAAYGLGGREVIVWGAGRDGKRAAKALRRRGARLRHLVDIAPTKVGRRMLGVEVLSPESLAEEPGCLVVAVVGIKGARAEIRAAMEEMGYREGEKFVCLG
jgi:hypothetical protein